MDEKAALTMEFERNRGRLRAVAYRMLGSLSEADDAVQETWIRLGRTDAATILNLEAWLTTVVGRVCLNMLRSRTTRREDPLDERLPDPVVSPVSGVEPEQEALVADSVGLALMVVLERLAPAERLAFVLHDMFSVPFEEIAPAVDRTPAATRQLASRARRRVQGATPRPDADVARQRRVVDAFFAAAERGDFDALVGVLDPDVVLRSDQGPGEPMRLVRRAEAVAGQALMFAGPQRTVRPVLVNGAAGVVVEIAERPVAVMAFTVAGDRVVAIDALGDAARLRDLDLATALGGD